MKIIKVLLLSIIFLFQQNAYSENSSFIKWVIDFKKIAIKHGISVNTVNRIMDKAIFLPKVIEYDRYQPEFYEDTKTYINKRVTANKIKIGNSIYLKNKTLIKKIENEFQTRNCKLIGLSVDSVDDHLEWKKDIEETQNASVNYPLIADEDLNIAKLYNMLPAQDINTGDRTAMTNATVRSIFLIDPDKKIRMMLTYPMTTGRNFDEIIRVLDSVQLTSKRKVATPANWKKNEDVIIVPSVSDDEAKELFGDFKKIKPYLRYTKLD